MRRNNASSVVATQQEFSDSRCTLSWKKKKHYICIYARSINDLFCRMCREKLLVFQHWITPGLKHVSIISLVTRVTSVRPLSVSCNTCARWVLLGFAERYNVPDSFLELHRVFKATYLEFHYRFWCIRIAVSYNFNTERNTCFWRL